MEIKEIFKDIPNYEGYYQVSNLGNVKSLKRKWRLKSKILSTHPNGNGYLSVVLSIYKKPKQKQVHQLVAMAFLNHKPNGLKLVVDHIDNNKLNNKLSNLQIITHRENLSKDKKNKYSKYTGITFNKSNKRWFSRIRINGKRKYLGSFKTELEASYAYQNELRKLNK